MNELISMAREKSLVGFVGAGVSMGPPSSLPGWYPLNAAIFGTLRKRLAAGIQREGMLQREESLLTSERNAGRYPPEYQAQVIEEMCGERYFRALQSLDVDVTNAGHRGIATLAAAGALRAIVTTNFDRLIERALEDRGVAYEAAFETVAYVRLRDRLRAGGPGPLPIIKIHGSVADHLSMIDTLKQRRKGRSLAIEECLEQFFDAYWLYLGFSADDLVIDPAYLGLAKGASRSQGATFVAHPGSSGLGAGAVSLMAAYGPRGTIVAAEVAAVLSELCTALGQPAPIADAPGSATGTEAFQHRLEQWSASLSLAATGVCLAAILESARQSETAARVLDRLARKEIYEERGTPDFEMLQLQYGRLGAAFGRFVHVPDLNGAASNASVEAVQSLLRLHHTSLAPRAMGWMPSLYLWLNQGSTAMGLAAQIIKGVAEGDWGLLAPQSDEEAVDAWLAAAQVCIVNTHSVTLSALAGTFEDVLNRARRAGDVVRTARVVALYLLATAATAADLPALAARYTAEITEVRRVGDGVAIGFMALALGRWHTGPGGMALAHQTQELKSIGERALQYLNTAVGQLDAQGIDPWVLFARIHAAKALFDVGEIDSALRTLSDLGQLLDRFPVFMSHAQEAHGQIQLAIRNPDAAGVSLRNAIAAAETSGLALRRDLLAQNYKAQFDGGSSHPDP